MSNASFLSLIQNAALLLALVVLFDLIVGKRRIKQSWPWQVLLGMTIGGIGIILMMTPWVLAPNIIFDTRSVLLGISGLFFGTLPTLIAMIIAAAYRIYLGGIAARMGVSVILATGTIGILWRRRLRKPLDRLSAGELYLFGVLIHVVMMACSLVLPWGIARQILNTLTLPVMLIYPPATMILGLLLVNRLRREHIADERIRNEARLKSLVTILQQPVESIQEFLDFALNQAIELTESKIGYIFLYSEETEQFKLNSISKGAMAEYELTDYPLTYNLAETGLLGEAVRQRKPIILNDYAADNPLKKGYPAGHLPIHKYLTIPVFQRGHIVAVVGVANKEDNYDDSDMTQLSLLMDGVWKAVEQKRADEALRQSEAQYRRIVDTAQEGIWIIDADHRTTYVNPHITALLGYSLDEMLGRPAEDFMYPEDLPDFYHRIEERRKGKHAQYELRFRHKDGRTIWVIVSAAAILDDEGEFAGSLAMMSDISARKRTESILKARLHLLQYASTHTLDELLRETLDTICELVNSPIGFYHFLEEDQNTISLQEWSTQTVNTHCTAQGKGLHYDIEQAGVWADCVRERRVVIHNDFSSLPNRKGMPPGHAEVLRELVVPVFRGEKIYAMLGVGNKPAPYDEDDAELVSTFADLAWDIAIQKRAEESLRQSNDTAQALLNAATDSVFLLDQHGRVIAANQTTAQQLGTTTDKLIGSVIYDLLPKEIAQSRRHQLETVCKTGTPLHFEDERAGIYFEHSIYPIPNAEGSIERVAIFARDITERKLADARIQAAHLELQRLLEESERSRRALLSVLEDQKITEEKLKTLNLELEQRIEERTAQLAAANKELEAFAYSVSHDLRAPLRALDGFSSALFSDYQNQLDEQGKHYLNRIQEASRRMGQLIEDLLNLSRVTRRDMKMTQVDLSALTFQLAEELKAQLPERDIVIDIAPNMVVRADANLLKIAMDNLLSNAVKFSSKRPQIRIKVGVVEQNGKNIYYVRDNGVGFDMAYADKLFVPFQRLHSHEEFAGTGIGLVTVQRIISRHGGRLWPEAKVNKGATFYFTLEA
ncbi:MAG: GAF domain-containing protein [Chloroflexota bacterium]